MTTLGDIMRWFGISLVLWTLTPIWAHALEWKQTTIQQQAGPSDEEARATFVFTNTGDKPVTISDVHTSCGCTVPALKKRVYAPGESGELDVVFTFNALVGKQQKTITVSTDEESGTPYQLALEVDIPKIFSIERYFLVWRRGEPLETKTLDFTVISPELIKVVGIEANNERFEAEIENGDEPGSYQIKITPNSTETVVQSSFVVKTDFPAKAPKVLTVYALVR